MLPNTLTKRIHRENALHAEVDRLRADKADLLAALKDYCRYHTDKDWRWEQEAHANETTAGNVSALEILEARVGAAIARAEGRAK